MKKLLVLSCTLLVFSFVKAQKKIVILGSSTAYGSGASPFPDSSWAGRLGFEFNKNTGDGKDTTIVNLAWPGYVTYKCMPSSYVPPLSLSPNIVIISLPSNDVFLPSDYDKKETMDNLRLMFQLVNAAGIPCYISTSQPRNDLPEFYK